MGKDPWAEVILFGSRVRGQATLNSDWDVLILLDHHPVTRLLEQEFRDVLFDVELEIEEPVSTFVFSRKDWESRLAASPFYKSIQQEGIPL